MADRSRSAPFSTHARGVPLFDRDRFMDVPRHIARVLLDFRDLSSSGFWFLSTQTWYTLHCTLVTIISCTFFSFFETDHYIVAPIDWSIVGFIVVLPLAGFTFIAYLRKEKCMDDLSKVKLLMMNIYLFHEAHDQVTGTQDAVRQELLQLLQTMREYFVPARFYSRYYPYTNFKTAMIQIAMDRARYMGRSHACLARLSTAARALGAGDAMHASLVVQQLDWVLELGLGLSRMSNVKEYRLPQGVRSFSRLYIGLMVPIFFGPYWGWVRQQTNFGFAFFFSIIVEIGLVAVLNISLTLEDPFDNLGMDGIFIDESLYDVQQLLDGEGFAVFDDNPETGRADKDPETGEFGNAQDEVNVI